MNNDCKDIKDEEECKKRIDCLLNKTKKCQKKPAKAVSKTKKNLSPVKSASLSSVKLDSIESLKSPSFDKTKSPVLKDKFSIVESEGATVESESGATVESEGATVESESGATVESTDKIRSPKNAADDPCKERDKVDKEIKELNQIKRGHSEECNKTKFMSEAEQSKLLKLMDLIKYIFLNRETLKTCQDLFDKFPESNERTKGLLSKPYIFEALWKIVFLLRLDNLTDGYDREYKNSLQEDQTINEYYYLNDENRIANINSGSESGIADFYFTVIDSSDSKHKRKQSSDKSESVSACEEIGFIPKIHDAYIFTSKFYRNEKGLTNYDISDIAIEALEKFGKKDFKIVSLVRNSSEFRNRMQRSSKDVVKSYIDSNLIFDEGDLNLIYYPKLYNWILYHFLEEGKNIGSPDVWRQILRNSMPIINISDNLRFHQKYVVEYTNNRVTENMAEGADINPGRFIWGAVARSGKSYMVGGLVAKRKPKFVLLILGAVNETKPQFIDDLFKKYNDLKEYEVIDFQNAKDRDIIPKKDKKYVVVISQESLRAKIREELCKNNPEDKRCKKNKVKQLISQEDVEIEDDGVKGYSNVILDKIKQFLVEPDKIIFFDEIHQGSGSDSMQEETIRFFYDEKYPKPLLIMVTATYAKPLAKYGESIDGKESVLIEWNYEMIMKMKNFRIENVTISDDYFLKIKDKSVLKEDERNSEGATVEGELEVGATVELEGEGATVESDNADYLIDPNSENFFKKMALLKSITKELNANGKSCQDIAHEYDKNPELVYLLPTLKEKYAGAHDSGIDESYNIVVDDGGAAGGEEKINIRRNLKQIFRLNPGSKRTFKYSNAVNKLLSYIYNDVYNELLEKEYNFVANGEGGFHSQLWFLPTSMKNADGKPDKTKGEPEENDRAIVGPMLKNLGMAIINHPLFINFNVCVVHSGAEKETTEILSVRDEELDDDEKSKVYFHCIKSNKYKGNVKACIKAIENETKKQGKSLIILTAQRLRLGISLPCVDVAIHMDNIKSYDIIYQSMFRVLTERPGKARGFFVDMVIDRAIQFFYKYTKIQKNISAKKMTREHIKKNLLLFDAGSIRKSIGFSSITEPINSYSDIATEFKIDKNEKAEEFESFKKDIFNNKEDEDYDSDDYEEGIKEEDEEESSDSSDSSDSSSDSENIDKIAKRQTDVVQLLGNLYKDDGIKDELMEKIGNIFEQRGQKNKGKKEKEKEKDKDKGKKMKSFKEQVPLGNEELQGMAASISPPAIQVEDIKTIFKNIVEQIKNIFTLIILFNGDEIVLRDAINSDGLDIDRIKDCNDPDIMYYCYLISNREQTNKVGDIVSKKDGLKGEIMAINSIKAVKEAVEGAAVEEYEEEGEGEGATVEVEGEGEGATVEGEGEGATVELLKGGATKSFKVSWEDGTEQDYNEKDFKTSVINMSIPDNFNLKGMHEDYIRQNIEKNIDLIKFLLDNQKDGEINNLFDNIKEEMKGLKGKLDNEKRAFNNADLKGCPPNFFIDNEKVLETIRKYLSPKDNEKNLFGEVFTPLELVCKMLSHLPAKVWKDPSLTWLDPSNGIANFPIIVYYKLMDSLKDVKGLENEKKRSKHIIENMIYMNELNPVNVALTKKIFKMIDPDATPNITKGDFIKNHRSLIPDDREKFDIIIGNPPYNESRIKETSDSPLYSKFITAALEITDKLLFIVPSRWFSGGKGLNEFRKSMLSRDDIVLINHIENSKTIWPTVGIAGGVNYFLVDKEYKGLTHFIDEASGAETDIKLNKFDILMPNVSAYSIINKIADEPKLSDIYLSTGHFGIISNSEYFQDTPTADTLKCYVAKAKGSVKYVDKKHIKQEYKFWKVFTPQAAQGSKTMKDGFGALIIGRPNEIASQTYFSFKVDSEAEAESLKSYLETKFANFMLSLRKGEHHIKKDTLLWTPLPPLDKGKDWTDEAVYKFYKLTDSEIRVVEKEISKPVATKTRKNVEPDEMEGHHKQAKQTKSKREKRISNTKSKRASKPQKTKGGNKITRKFLSFFSR